MRVPLLMLLTTVSVASLVFGMILTCQTRGIQKTLRKAEDLMLQMSHKSALTRMIRRSAISKAQAERELRKHTR